MTEDILKAITSAVEEAVDKKINGKLMSIKEHLNRQDIVMTDVRDLLEERKFLVQLWRALKVVGGTMVSVAGAYLLYKNIK